MSWVTAETAPLNSVSTRPPGAKRLMVSRMPTSPTELAYLWAYGMHG